MRNVGLIALLVAFATVLVANTNPPEPLSRNEAPVFDVRVTVRPVADDQYMLLPRPKPNSFRCSVLVFEEPESRRAWSTDEIVIAPGERGETTSSLGSLSLHFASRITEGAEVAETIVTITRDGKILSRQRTTVALRPGRIGREYRPAS